MELHFHELAAQFQAGNQPGPDLGLSGQESRQAIQGVMIRQGESRETGLFRQCCQGFGRICAVREEGVAVEIDHKRACLFAR